MNKLNNIRQKLLVTYKVWTSSDLILVCTKGCYSSIGRLTVRGFFLNTKQQIKWLEEQHLRRLRDEGL